MGHKMDLDYMKKKKKHEEYRSLAKERPAIHETQLTFGQPLGCSTLKNG